MSHYSFSEICPIVATWQGSISYAIFSIYAVQPEIFFYYIGRDPGAFLFSNMLYGNAVHIYTRPCMRRLKLGFRIIYSIYGSYSFNFSSLLIFFSLHENYHDRPLFVALLSYFVGRVMYSLFYTFFYFVDKSISADSRTGESYMDIIFSDN